MGFSLERVSGPCHEPIDTTSLAIYGTLSSTKTLEGRHIDATRKSFSSNLEKIETAG
jgi:hypothetical protein